MKNKTKLILDQTLRDAHDEAAMVEHTLEYIG